MKDRTWMKYPFYITGLLIMFLGVSLVTSIISDNCSGPASYTSVILTVGLGILVILLGWKVTLFGIDQMREEKKK